MKIQLKVPADDADFPLMVGLNTKDDRSFDAESVADTSTPVGGILVGRLSQQAAVAELGQTALVTHDVNTLFEIAVALLVAVLDIEFANVLHQPVPDEPLILMAGIGWHEDVRVGETTIPADIESQAGYALMSDEPVLVDDLATETRFAGSDLMVKHKIRSGMSVAIRGTRSRYGVLGVHTTKQRQFTVEEADFLRSIANILGSASENSRIIEQVEQQARYANALAECASTLLASHGDDRIEGALEALLKATEATYVFVERNVIDPELGFCSSTVAEVGQSGDPDATEADDYWDLVPWANMPTSRKALEAGEPFVVIPEQLEGPEYEQYASDRWPVKSELNIPIFLSGEWEGLIGFGDDDQVRNWGSTDLSVLKTAAGMFGAFWEREADREELRELNRAKDEFLASVSHELRTPLTAVVGFGQVLKDDEQSMSAEQRAELLEMVVSQGTDLTNIVNDLLVAAKADIGKLHLTLVQVNLGAQTAQVLESFEQDAVAGIDFNGDRVSALGDPDRVRQIIRNLVSNAFRYGGKHIEVEVLAGDQYSKVLVSDDGYPIPEADRDRIFEPYQRAHNAPGVTGSLGLGLAISRQLARLMGGDLVYRYEYGRSIFELALPKSS